MRYDYKQSLKEVVRHAMFVCGVSKVILWYKRKRGYSVSHLSRDSLADRFSAIYTDGAWVHSESQASRSGLGSDPKNMHQISLELLTVFRDFKVRSLLDIGCGDFQWMSQLDLPCDYIGVDVVPEIIAANKEKYERGDRIFILSDATKGPLPVVSIILCREVLFHLSFADGKRLLSNIARSSELFIATTDSAILFNSDILTGDYRKINLERAPYKLPPPLRYIRDEAVSQGRGLGVWRTRDLRG